MNTTNIDVDDVQTWPLQAHTIARQFAQRLHGTTEHLTDFEVPCEDDRHFREALRGERLRAYHATRLLPHELDSIRDRGLVRLTADHISNRLEAAQLRGEITSHECQLLLKRSSDFSQAGGYKNRENRICLTLGRATYDEDAYNVYDLLNTWGGEAIYFHLEGGDLRTRLTSLGRPALVVVGLDPSPDGPLRAYGKLLTYFVETLLGRRPKTALFYGADIAPGSVKNIWQPGDAEYDRHVELPR